MELARTSSLEEVVGRREDDGSAAARRAEGASAAAATPTRPRASRPAVGLGRPPGRTIGPLRGNSGRPPRRASAAPELRSSPFRMILGRVVVSRPRHPSARPRSAPRSPLQRRLKLTEDARRVSDQRRRHDLVRVGARLRRGLLDARVFLEHSPPGDRFELVPRGWTFVVEGIIQLAVIHAPVVRQDLDLVERGDPLAIPSLASVLEGCEFGTEPGGFPGFV